MIAIPADPNDPEDFPVSVAGLKRAHMGRRFRILRHRLGVTQEQFATTYGIPIHSLRQGDLPLSLDGRGLRRLGGLSA